MPILGIGCDVVEISRITEALKRHGPRFVEKLFSERERVYCDQHQDPAPHYAGRFAAKEAIVKALGCGFGKDAAWLQIEILNDANGKPEVILSPALQERFGNPKMLLSISHEKSVAMAVVLWES